MSPLMWTNLQIGVTGDYILQLSVTASALERTYMVGGAVSNSTLEWGILD